MIPQWLHLTAVIMLVVGIASTIVVTIDVVRYPQHMTIMNFVWPITGLYAGPFAVWGYFVYGRLARDDLASKAMQEDRPMPHKAKTPFPAKVGKGATHCGAGCTLGDIIAETLVFLMPAVAVWFGYRSIFGDKIFAVWIVDYILAFVIGVGFQYATIKPMNDISSGKALVAAIKADTVSLTSWQVGMYGGMAILYFGVFRALYGVTIEPNMAEFWASMQIAMIAGFVTAYPVNWWLIRKGIKEAM